MPKSGDEGRPDASDILGDLWRLIESVIDDSAPALEALGLSPKAFFVLEAVADHPFPAELARRLHLPPPTVTYLVKQLEARGFLERRAEPGDLRKFRLVRSPAGSRAGRQGRDALGDAFGERLGRLGPGELAAFGRTARRLAADADDGP